MPFLQTFGAGASRGFTSGLIFGQQTATFNYTGSVQTWTVPANTQSIYAYVFGAVELQRVTLLILWGVQVDTQLEI